MSETIRRNIIACPANCPDPRRKSMTNAVGQSVEMCYAHIAALPTGPIKPIITRDDSY